MDKAPGNVGINNYSDSGKNTAQSSSANTISGRYGNIACLGVFSIYLFLHFALEWNKQSNHPICPAISGTARPTWTRDFNFLTTGGLLFAICLQFSRLTLTHFRSDHDLGTKSCLHGSLTVNLIAAISHCSIVTVGWGGVCTDAYGIKTPGAIWPEWVITVPFMLYIALAVDDKKSLSGQDWLLIVCQFLAMLCGASLQIVTSKRIEILVIVVGCLFAGSAQYAWFQAKADLAAMLAHCKPIQTQMKGSQKRKLLLATRKATLTGSLAILFPIFPIIFALKIMNWIDADLLFCLFLFAASTVKVYYASVCMDAHLEVSHPSIIMLEAERLSSDERRAFLRHFLTAVWSPFESITLGVQLLVNDDDATRADDENVLKMIRYELKQIGTTMDDVMLLQKVEEGSMELQFYPFSVTTLLYMVEDQLYDICADVGIKLQLENQLPLSHDNVFGDKARIRYVLTSLIYHVIKPLSTGKVVHVKTMSEGECSESLLVKKSMDGRVFALRIDIELLVIIASPSMIDTSASKNSLVETICKSIVALHGGSILTNLSEQGDYVKGFTIRIPMELNGPSSPTGYDHPLGVLESAPVPRRRPPGSVPQ